MAVLGSPEAVTERAESEVAKGARLIAKDWLSGIRQRNQLRNGIETYDEYLIRTTIGLYRAKQFLGSESALVPNADAVLEAHRIAFGDVVKFGGLFRRQNDRLHTADVADSARIPAEMRRTMAEMNHILVQAKTATDRFAAVAYYHARFAAVHPFRDGNKRIGLLIAETQLEKMTGMPANALLRGIYNDRTRYEAALSDGVRKNDLTALTTMFAAACGVEIPQGVEVRAPARVAPRPNATEQPNDSLFVELQAGALSPTWAADVLRTPKSQGLQPPAERRDTPPASPVAISERGLFDELSSIRKSHLRSHVPTSTEAAERSVETILQGLSGPNLSVAGLRLHDEAKRFARGEVDELRMKLAIREHMVALEESNRATSERTKAHPVAIAPPQMQRHVTLAETRYRAAAFPIEGAFLAAIEILREPIIAGDDSRTAAALKQAREWVDNLGGSGTTNVPLRCAVQKYLLGKAGGEEVKKCLREHCAKNPALRTARLDLSRVARAGLER